MYPGYCHNRLEEEVFGFLSRGLTLILGTLKESERCVGAYIIKGPFALSDYVFL